ncbi:MAG TPA: protein kinase, partial [Rhodanobacteraceae bacterium]|nr:protein kinase [Rhodanobacteraceae bacterium]
MTAGRTIAPQYSGRATVTGMLTMAELRPGDVVAARFRIVRLLGMGGMGVVYHAHDMELDVDVALKLLRPELASRPDAFERFRQELLLARQVSSPHVVRIHDLVRHGEVWLISMDFVPGQSLERLLDTKGSLAPEDAIRIVRQLALGLVAAHQRGVVHRDLKPANVLIGEDNEARITDFGVARSAGSTGITVSGVIIGTPEYLSPEQARAEPVDGRSDLYALGLIFFEMLTGTLPFRGGTPAEMLAQRIVRDPPPPDTIRRDLPTFAVRLCSRLLELKPSRRFQTAEDVIRAIDEKRVRMPFRPRRALLALAAVLAIVAIGAGIEWRLRATGTPAAVQPVTTALDVAVLPIALAQSQPEDKALAAGVREVLTTALTGMPDLHSADVRRVDRALTELDYDAAAARRQRTRVADVLGARALLEGDLEHGADGRYVLRFALVDPATGNASWTLATPSVAENEVANAFSGLARNLVAKLGRTGAAIAVPDPAVLRLIGRLGDVDNAVLDDSAKLLDAARTARNPDLWWAIEDRLDRANRSADAANAARQALDSLATDDSRDARRARAYANLLLDKDAEAGTLLAALTASGSDHPVRFLLARAQSEAGNLDDARKTLLAIVREDPRNADAWFALGKDAILQGDYRLATDEYLTQAMIKANRLGNRRMQADVTNALGVGYQNLGDLASAARQFEAAARMRNELGDQRGQATSLRNLASIEATQGDMKSAEKTLATARTILEPLADKAAMADLVNDVGVLEEERGEYRRALDAYREALGYRQAENNQRSIGESQINVGFAYYQLGEFDNAQTYLQQASQTYSKIDDHAGAVNAELSLSLAEIARGELGFARQSLEAGLAKAESLQMAEARAIGAAYLGELDRLEGRIADALSQSNVALQQFRQRDDPRGIVEMQLLQSAAFRDVGDWDAAEAALGDLTADTVANREQGAILLLRRGEIALGRGAAAEALAKASQAVAAAQEIHSYNTELPGRLLRARALLAGGKAK